MDERVQEYVAWASAERTDGAVSSPPGEPRLAGYFLIRAADQRTALEIARSCPHARYGGRIVLREIEPT
jgi:hypothetical protein